jgi:hypothetical protein
VSGTKESSEEIFARKVVAHFTGAISEHADGKGAPPGSPDALLTYPDGRVAPLETTIASRGTERHLADLLKRHGAFTDAPGQWGWSVQVASPEEFDRVVGIADHIMLLMESYGAGQLWDIDARRIARDVDAVWARDEAESIFSPHPNLKRKSDDHPLVYWSEQSSTAVWRDDGEALTEGIRLELLTPNSVRHLEKLLRYQADERHLFLLVGSSGATPAAHIALVGPENVPTEDPDLPEGVTDLWLHSGFGQTMVHWRRGTGWELLTVPGGTITG